MKRNPEAKRLAVRRQPELTPKDLAKIIAALPDIIESLAATASGCHSTEVSASRCLDKIGTTTIAKFWRKR